MTTKKVIIVLITVLTIISGCAVQKKGGPDDSVPRIIEPGNSFEFILKTGHKRKITSIAVSPDGKYILSGGVDRKVKLWNLETGDMIRDLEGNDGIVASTAISPDGRILAAGVHPGSVLFWEADTGKLLRKYKDWGKEVTFSPDGKLIASAGFDRPIKIWDAGKHKLILEFPQSRAYYNSLAFSPDGSLLASGDGAGGVKIWESATGKLLKNLKGHKNWVHSVVFSPDSKKLASGSFTMKSSVKWETIRDMGANPPPGEREDWAGDETVILWHVETGKALRKFRHPAGVQAVTFSPDGNVLVSAGIENCVRFWDMDNGKELMKLNFPNSLFLNAAIFTPDGQQLLTAGGDGIIRKINPIDGRVTGELKRVEGKIRSVAYSPDGKILASAGDTGIIRLWNPAKKQLSERIAVPGGIIHSISFSPDGKNIASAGHDGKIRLWNAESAEMIGEFAGHSSPALTVDISPDGKKIASGDAEGFLGIWETGRENPVYLKRKHREPVLSVKFSPDGKFILSGSRDKDGKTLILSDSGDGRDIRSYKNGHPAWDVSFYPGGKKSAVTAGRNVRIWDTEQGKTLMELTGQAAPVWAAELSPDGKYMVSGGFSRVIKLWDGETGKYIGDYTGHTDEIESLAFSPDNRTFASGGKDSAVRIWSVNKTGKSSAFLLGFSDGEWIFQGEDNKFNYSPGAVKHIAGARINGKIIPVEEVFKKYGTPDSSPDMEEPAEKAPSFTLETLQADLKSPDVKTRGLAIIKSASLGDNRAIPLLTEALEDENGNVAVLAAWSLGRCRDRRAVKPLMKKIGESDDVESSLPPIAIWALGEIGDPSSFDFLADIVKKSADTGHRERAAGALMKVDPQKAGPLMLTLLENNDENIRIAAARSFIDRPGKKAVEPLIKALRDRDKLMRIHSALALGMIGDKRALKPLESLGNDPSEEVREAARTAVNAIKTGNKSVIKASSPRGGDVNTDAPPIGELELSNIEDTLHYEQAPHKVVDPRGTAEVLKDLRSKSADIRSRAVLKLGNSGVKSKEVVDSLIKALKDENSNVRWNATKALGKLGDGRAVKPLLESLKDEDKDVREDAVEALGRLGGEEVIDPIISMLEDPFVSVRALAADALVEFKTDRVVNALVKALQDKEPAVRKTAAVSLGEMKAKKAVAALKNLLKDPDLQVRKAAEKALKMIGEKKE